MAENDNYNGWANYPTWDVHLWLTNDEGSYNAAQGVVDDAGTPRQAADDLRELIEGNNPLFGTSSLYADILGWALQIVDWEEVSRAFAPDEGGGDV